MLDYPAWLELLRNERLPAAVVDLDAFDRNLATMAKLRAPGSKPLRLATKSVRVPELIDRALRAKDSPFRGLMTYSAEETAYFARKSHPASELRSDAPYNNLLLAYPTLQPSDAQALREAHESGSGRVVSAVVDSIEGAQALAAAMKGSARPFGVVIEVDMSLRLFGGALHLGVRRSPVRTPSDLAALIAKIRARCGAELEIRGMMAYEAQVAGLGDRNPYKRLLNPVAHWIRVHSARQVARRRAELARAFETALGAPPRLFNGGGTGSLTFAHSEPALTELAAGSGLLAPHLFDYYSDFRLEPAAFFALQAIRRSDRGYVTCQGGGYVASGEPGRDRLPIPHLPEGLRLIGMEGAGEVQTPLRGISLPELGAPVIFRHAKAGELAERFNEYLLVSGGKVVGRAKTYRGLGLCFF